MTREECREIQRAIDRAWRIAYDPRVTDAERGAARKEAMRMMAQIRTEPPA